jgi:phosphatidylglycerol lysyltransferase
MTKNKKKILNKIISWSGLFFFALAAFMIYKQLSKYSPEDIKNALVTVPSKNIIYACIASFLGSLALSSYDFLALRYIHHKLPVWKWMFAGFIGFSVSNNAGHAIVSGGAIRYRLYTRWKIGGGDIVKMVMFSGFTYLVACFFLEIIGFICSPQHIFSGSSPLINQAIIAVSFLGLIFYVWVSSYYKKPICLKEIQFEAPGFKMSIAQILIGSLDILMASLVLYSVLEYFIDIPFLTFIGVFIIAQLLGVYSQVPGGLGVFEIVFAKLLPDDQNQAVLFAILILYRLIYYLLPLLISGMVLISYEIYLAKRKNTHKIKKNAK